MRTLNPSKPARAFFLELHAAPASLLVLDYDGTLAPFAPRPEDAALYPQVVPLLTQISQCGTTLAFISGRPALDLATRLPVKKIDIYGAHGQEHLSPSGQLTTMPIARDSQSALDEIARAVEAAHCQSALERKQGTVALHWRGRPPPFQEKLIALAHHLHAALPETLQGLPFDGGFEFRVRGRDKGDALRDVLSRHPHAAVAYLGDDVTDEDAFRALPPRGIGVLVRPEYRETAADLWIRPPDELAAFLNSWVTAICPTR